ncbi:hypothetical protein ABIE65_001760 [Constrictibacter sp. MBR-5]|jgi:hypothetical protein|uniref:hypothetical protein n=1 Tax=Constrictibacter sp. MBR-5 TaxID=3156467 RepID=UPI0033908D0B
MDTDAILQRHETALMQLPNVQGVGIGEKGGKPAIKVFVSRKVPKGSLAESDVVPTQIEGVPTDVEEVGTISVQST